MRIDRAEQVGLVTCKSGHHSLFLDSRDHWADILQGGRPKRSSCRCKCVLFRLELCYEFRENGDVRWIGVTQTCTNCGREASRLEIDIKYSPTDELVSRPLDPVEKPWLQPKRRQITAYWNPEDAKRFAEYLVNSLNANIIQDHLGPNSRIERCRLDEVEFFPELKTVLYFTVIEDAQLPRVRDPEKCAPFIALSGPYHILLSWPDNFGLLHYISYATEVASGAEIVKQPLEFIDFASEASAWLKKTFCTQRGKYTADNLDEYVRIFEQRQFKAGT